MTCQKDGSTGVKTQSWLFENWARTRRHVIPTVYNPTTVEQIVAAVLAAERESGSVKAVGSGWSYSDVAVDNSTTHVINTDLLTGMLSSTSVSSPPTALIPYALKDMLQPRARYFVEVKAGTKVYALNCLLDGMKDSSGVGLAMRTLGGSNGQSIAGAISTGTHGSDVNMAPIADSVRAIHLVGPGGQEWWIERDGDRSITDPGRMERARDLRLLCPDIQVRYDTRLFRSILVSLGRMGVIYSYVVEVVDAFLLSETRTESNWTREKGKLRRDVQVPPTLYNGPRFLEIVLNPYPDPNGEHMCIVTNRGPVRPGTVPDPEMPASKTEFQLLCEMQTVTPVLLGLQAAIPVLIATATAAAIAGLAAVGAIPIFGPALVAALTPAAVSAATAGLVTLQGALTALMVASPGANLPDQLATVCNLASAVGQKQVVPQIISAVIPTSRNPNAPSQTRESFRILTGQVACLPLPNGSFFRPEESECERGMDGLEFAVDISPGSQNIFLFIDRVIALADSFYMQNMPVGFVMSLRFTTKTDAILGMQQFARTCSVEFIILRGFAGIPAFLTRLYEIAEGSGAIPHWGLIHELSATQVRNHYPELSTWRQSLQYLIEGGNGKAGTFRSEFSVARGLEPEAIRPPLVVVVNPQTGESFPCDFGSCFLHQRRTVTCSITNTGEGTLRVLSVDVDGDFRDQDIPPSGLLGTFGRPHNIEYVITKGSALRGEEIEVTATFVAEDAGPHSGNLLIITNAANLPGHTIRIPLTANVDIVDIELLQPAPSMTLDFGSNGIGEYRTSPLLVRNAGTMNMTLDSVSFSAPEAASQITIELGPIGTGQPRIYNLKYVPSQVGTLATDVTLHFVHPGAPARLWQDIVFRITAIAIGAQARLSPPLLSFGNVVMGMKSAPQPLTLENTGQIPLSLTGISLGGAFDLATPLPSSLGPGLAQNLDIVFRPGYEGNLVSAFSVYSSSAQLPTPVILQGTGLLQALLVPTPDSVVFDATPTGGRSGERTILLQNHGAVPVTINTIAVTGPNSADFMVTSTTCAGATLPPEHTCEIHIVMVPSSGGTKAAVLEAAYDGPNSPLQVQLTGLANSGQGLVPEVSELDFGRIALGAGGSTRKVSFTNQGTVPANVQSVSIVGANAADFVITSDGCMGGRLGPGGVCTIEVAAAPNAAGACSASLSIGADVAAFPVSLRAEGVIAKMEWSSTGLEFGNMLVGGRSPRQDAQLFNTGDATLVVRSITVEGDFECQDVVSSINTVPPDQAKYFRIWFLPTAVGTRTGSLNVECDPPGSTYSLSLEGIGFLSR